MIRKKVKFSESSPMWKIVCEFSLGHSEGYIVHYKTFGQI